MDNGLFVTVRFVAAMDVASDIAAEIGDGDRTARHIAAVIGRLITAGYLPVDSRLPTVRELSRQLGVSPTTVSEAWRSLADVGAIEARGRNGTYVRLPMGPGGPRRYRRITEGPGHFALDLSSGVPDPALLPDLGPVVSRVGKQSLTSSYLDHPVLPALEEELVASWPFPPEAVTVVDGAMDALDRVAQHILRLGDRVVVEHPTFPPLLDLLERLGCEVIGVDVDDHGLEADGLRDAMAARPTALFLQPRAQNPAGVALDGGSGECARRRARRLPHDRHRGRPRQRHLERRHSSASGGGSRSARSISVPTPRATAPISVSPQLVAPATP